MARTVRASPAELVDGWPDGVPSDPIARVAQQFALNLREAVGDRSLRAVADLAGVHHVTLLAILAGRTWPDMSTISKLERGLGQSLWPAGVSIEGLDR
ncbi:helix-turn-helix domain-containing protein [Agromyces mediolanus]|uniref:HTH cro/C1-type domain-containing protein n=1 Tax=Agromyces mediolanus TaxID=41986 RepID=A0A918F6L1_AGRME|nr:helix-turn-helix transcriptional regulator [Agromyces mediolanus]GGR13532.1 hypothetical protein GCM10010196_02580 [Agromyces mediolanus]GLJ72662.1 hypothetical protein GCM10017583_19180 [Agromyces mediolanus]